MDAKDADVHEGDPSRAPNEQPAVRCGEIAEHNPRLDAPERHVEPLVGERLQQVVERPRFERLERVDVVGGHEDDVRDQARPQLLQHVESGALRHLDVEKHQVGLHAINRGYRFGA